MAMLITEAAKVLCKDCLHCLRVSGKACAWRSMGGEFCDEVREVDRKAISLLTTVKRKIVEEENAN